MRLGIDFGTTRTVVAAVDDGRHPIAAFNDGGEFRDYIPGIAALRGGELIVGWEAARALSAASDGRAIHAIRSIKRAATELLPDDPVPGLPGVSPYDPALADRGDLDGVAGERRPDLMANEIAETYTCARDGTISVVIENTSRSYELGALR